MFDLTDSWVWDFWFADDGESYHLFFLYASRALHDADARHGRASIGHAISVDLVNWARVEDALVRDDAPAFDDVATWTGSVVQGPDGVWRMFYTGFQLDPVDGRGVQRIGMAVSTDLRKWDRAKNNPVLEAERTRHRLGRRSPDRRTRIALPSRVRRLGRRAREQEHRSALDLLHLHHFEMRESVFGG